MGWKEVERERQLGEKEGLAIGNEPQGQKRGTCGPWVKGLRGGAQCGWGT